MEIGGINRTSYIRDSFVRIIVQNYFEYKCRLNCHLAEGEHVKYGIELIFHLKMNQNMRFCIKSIRKLTHFLIVYLKNNKVLQANLNFWFDYKLTLQSFIIFSIGSIKLSVIVVNFLRYSLYESNFLSDRLGRSFFRIGHNTKIAWEGRHLFTHNKMLTQKLNPIVFRWILLNWVSESVQYTDTCSVNWINSVQWNVFLSKV